MAQQTFNNTKITVEFDEDYQSRTNINSGENISSLFAKIRRFILDLKAVCFSGSYNDLSDTPDVVTKEYVDPIKSQAAINRTTLGTQCKNLCNVTYTNRKVHTVNITVNSDKSLGLLTDSTTSIVCVETLTPLIRLYANVTYILTGTNNGNIRIELRDSSKSNILVYDSGSGVEYTPNKDIDVYVCLRIEKSTSITSAITVYPMLRIKGTDDTYEPYKSSVDERLIEDKSNIAINKTTLGYRCKNLFNSNAVNWYQPTKTSIAKDGTITSTVTSDSRTWSYENAEYFLTLSAGKYIVRTITETIDNTASNIISIRGYNESGTQLFDIYPNKIGTKTKSFTITETTTIAIMFKLFTQTCKIMIRYADILDDTYEPYKPSLQEQITALEARIAALGG